MEFLYEKCSNRRFDFYQNIFDKISFIRSHEIGRSFNIRGDITCRTNSDIYIA